MLLLWLCTKEESKFFFKKKASGSITAVAIKPATNLKSKTTKAGPKSAAAVIIKVSDDDNDDDDKHKRKHKLNLDLGMHWALENASWRDAKTFCFLKRALLL